MSPWPHEVREPRATLAQSECSLTQCLAIKRLTYRSQKSFCSHRCNQSKIINEISCENEKQLLNDLYDDNDGRNTFGSCLSGLLQKRMGVDAFFKRTGIGVKSKITLGDFSNWLFHDLQAYSIIKKR